MKQLRFILLLLAVLAIIGHSTLTEGIHKGQEATRHATHVTEEKYHETLHTAQEGVQETVNTAKEKAEYARDRAGEISDRVQDSAQHRYDNIKDKVGGAGIYDKVAHTIQHNLDDAGNAINEGLNRVKETFHRTAHSGEEGVQEARNTVDETLEKAGHRTDEAFLKAGHRIADAPDSFREGVRGAGDYVREGYDSLKEKVHPHDPTLRERISDKIDAAGDAIKFGVGLEASKKLGEKVIGKVGEFAGRNKAEGESLENENQAGEGSGSTAENLAEWAKEKAEHVRNIMDAANPLKDDSWVKEKAHQIHEQVMHAAHHVKDAVDAVDEKFHAHHHHDNSEEDL